MKEIKYTERVILKSFKSKITLVLIKATDVNLYCKKIPKGNQNPYIEKQTTQWPKEKVQKDIQRSTKHTHKTKDRATRTPLKTGVELRCSGRVSSSCSIKLWTV